MGSFKVETSTKSEIIQLERAKGNILIKHRITQPIFQMGHNKFWVRATKIDLSLHNKR